MHNIVINDYTGINYSVYTGVEAEEYLYFECNQNANTASDETYWKPAIEYISEEIVG
jgi:hypothetical protein